MKRFVAVVVTSLVIAGCSVFGDRSGYEQVSYQVVETVDADIEIRRYLPRLAAEATVEDTASRDGPNQAFRLLFDYIAGENRAQSTIAMTTPVETTLTSAEIAMTAPVETARTGDGNLRMLFFLPQDFTAERAPEPTDPRIRIIEIPSQTMAVLRFSGLGGEGAIRKQREALLEALQGTQWRPDGSPVTLFYDPPWTLPPLRRNEVAIPVIERAGPTVSWLRPVCSKPDHRSDGANIRARTSETKHCSVPVSG